MAKGRSFTYVLDVSDITKVNIEDTAKIFRSWLRLDDGRSWSFSKRRVAYSLLTMPETQALFDWVRKSGPTEKRVISIKDAGRLNEERWQRLRDGLFGDGFFKQNQAELFDLNEAFASGLKLRFQNQIASFKRR